MLFFQVLTQAMAAESVRQTLLAEPTEKLKPAAIAERLDTRVRDLEKLPPRKSGMVQGEKSSDYRHHQWGEVPLRRARSQKTGAFLDQRENYAAAAEYARGEALDVFCYQGGFALHLAERCEPGDRGG